MEKEIVMKKRWNIKTRLGSMMLASCMLFSLLPMSVFTFATETAPVSVIWEPQEQTVSGQRQVRLKASLTQDGGSPAAALIDIHLDADEAAALQWEPTIDESVLGPTEPEDGENGSGEGGEPATPTEPEVGDGDDSASDTDASIPTGGETEQDTPPAEPQQKNQRRRGAAHLAVCQPE